MSQTLYAKVFDMHTVDKLGDDLYQLFIGTHFVNDATSAPAFASLREKGLPVAFPERTFATVDHIISTERVFRPAVAGELQRELEKNAATFGLRYFAPSSSYQGIVHVIGPELGLSQPGMTVCCGDSHTSTHGALGALAFGVGTTQIRDVLASQTLVARRLRCRQVWADGRLPPGTEAKDLILTVIRTLGVRAGIGFSYEFAGPAVDALTVEERMTLCNMAIEGGAQVGYVSPDSATFQYLRGRPFAPPAGEWEKAIRWWESLRSDPGAPFDDVARIDAAAIAPTVTWGTHPGQNVQVSENMPELRELPEEERAPAGEAYGYMGLTPGSPIEGTKIDVAFIGSCANGRLSDIERVAALVRGAGGRVAPRVRALVVPGSEWVYDEAHRLGYAQVLAGAGFDFRRPGCSACVGMNGDGLRGRELCASTSTRNFRGRQGSPTGRTLLMSPVMVAAAALAGEVTDARRLLARGSD